jgi:hypothetical protein
VLERDPGQLGGKVGTIRGDKVQAVVAVDALDIALGVHPLVEDQRQLPGASGLFDLAHDLIEVLVKEPCIVLVTGIAFVVDGHPGWAVNCLPNSLSGQEGGSLC